jgi:hypothetical protein
MSEHSRPRNRRDASPDRTQGMVPIDRPLTAAPSLQDSGPVPLQKALRLPRADRLDLLMRHNGMSEPVVVGTVYRTDGQKGPMHWLRRLQTLEGRSLALPLAGNYQHPQVPLFRLESDIVDGDLIAQTISVVPDRDREILEKQKPFSMVPLGPGKRLGVLPKNNLVKGLDGSVLVGESLLQAERAKLTATLETLESEAAAAKVQMDRETQRLTKETEEKNVLFQTLNQKITEADSDRQAIEAQVSKASEELADLTKRKDNAMAAYQQMYDFARDRASLLIDLDLISDEQFRFLSGQSEMHAPSKDMLSWQDDLMMNYGRAVSTIHAYLLSQGIIYPRWLVGNFLTLLRTNDLIILSGLSGAGKTQIVRSFAEALGGVAHVMPVKPNWTGAEDLLGFFNPLQRTYVRTPFLEALLAASRDPDRLHLICLDEMNLARAEYYFADFLSALEDRSRLAEVPLYSESEASLIQAEVRMLLAALRGGGVLSPTSVKPESSLNLDSLLQQPEVMAQIRSMFGESAAESFPAFHGRVRRALSTVLDIPSKVLVPANVRFIGAINVDQTTYALSPKVLDRAHVLRFENPLKYSVDDIRTEADRHMQDVPRVAPVHMPPVAFMPQRGPYPEYDANHPAAQWLQQIYRDYLVPLGLDVAFRTIRQAQMYWDLLVDVTDGDAGKHEAVAKNLIVLQKILPKLTIDGKTKAKFRQEETPRERWDIVREMEQDLRDVAKASGMHPNMQEELHRVRMAAEANDKIFNYWA